MLSVDFPYSLLFIGRPVAELQAHIGSKQADSPNQRSIRGSAWKVVGYLPEDAMGHRRSVEDGRFLGQECCGSENRRSIGYLEYAA